LASRASPSISARRVPSPVGLPCSPAIVARRTCLRKRARLTAAAAGRHRLDRPAFAPPANGRISCMAFPFPGDRMRLQLCTWPEVEARLAKSTGIIVPIGSTEQHGPNGLLGTDAICPEVVAEAAAER